MSEHLKAYIGSVSEENLAFTFPAANKANVIRYLTDTKEIDKYIIVDPAEEARMKAQQEAILSKFAPKNKQMSIEPTTTPNTTK